MGKVRNGKPAIALIKNASQDLHWVIVDEVVDAGGDLVLGIRDPGSGRIGHIAQQDFAVGYFEDVAVWLE
ncbi:MAG: hypothetical protein R3C10_07045 [Pirellulales bacterium]